MSSSLADGPTCSRRRVAKIHLSISSLTHLYRYCIKLQVCGLFVFYSTKALVYHGSDQTVCCNTMGNNIMKYRQLVQFFFKNFFVISHFLSFNQGNVFAIFLDDIRHFVKTVNSSPSLCVCPTPPIPGSGHVSG